MRALLRLQAVLLFRQATTQQGIFVGVSMALVGVFIGAIHAVGNVLHGETSLGPLLAFMTNITFMSVVTGALGAVVLMTTTLNGVDAIRWASPLRGSRVIGAHLLFWTLAAALPSAAITVLCAGEETSDLARFVALVGMTSTAAAATLVFQRPVRRRSVVGILLAFILVFKTTVAAAIGVLMTWNGEVAAGTLLLGFVFGINLVAGSWSFLHEEGGAIAGGRSTPVPAEPGPVGRVQGMGRAPTMAILCMTWFRPLAGLWLAMGFLYQFNPALPEWFTGVWIPLTVSSLGSLPLSAWRWLMATPMDRARAFRILFVPVLAVAGLMATTRFIVHEMESGRAELLHNYRGEGGRNWRRGLMAFADEIREFPPNNLQRHVPPDPAFMAARLHLHVRRQFGLDVPEDRILEDIRRGWPVLKAEWSKEEEDAIVDAVARVQSDLGSELRAADLLRRIVAAVMVILVSLLGLRLQLAGNRGPSNWTTWGIFPVLAVLALELEFQPGFPSILGEPTTLLYAAFQDTPAPVPALLFLASAVAAVLLWRSCGSAFRRLDITDLPRHTTGLEPGGNT